MKNTAELLGFHRDSVIPPVNSGEKLVKFFGKPAVIPARSKNEPLSIGVFTRRQADQLVEYENKRSSAIASGVEIDVFVPDNRLDQERRLISYD